MPKGALFVARKIVIQLPFAGLSAILSARRQHHVTPLIVCSRWPQLSKETTWLSITQVACASLRKLRLRVAKRHAGSPLGTTEAGVLWESSKDTQKPMEFVIGERRVSALMPKSVHMHPSSHRLVRATNLPQRSSPR
jgi:hypothetical protein